jgi:hypothetical protein
LKINNSKRGIKLEEKEVEIIENKEVDSTKIIKVLKNRKQRRAEAKLRKNAIHYPQNEEKARVGVDFSKLPSRKERRAEAKKNKLAFEPQYNGGVTVRIKTRAEIKIIINGMIRDKKNHARGVAE